MEKIKDSWKEFKIAFWRDLFASRWYQLAKYLLLLSSLLFLLYWIQQNFCLSPILFQSIGTSIIVLSATVFWDWIKYTRHYRNLASIIAIEIYYIYGCLFIMQTLFIKDRIADNDWKNLKLELAKYIRPFWYQKLAGLYDVIGKINNDDKIDQKRVFQAMTLSEQCYNFLTKEAKGITMPILQDLVKETTQELQSIPKKSP